jgi:hypothetical protein
MSVTFFLTGIRWRAKPHPPASGEKKENPVSVWRKDPSRHGQHFSGASDCFLYRAVSSADNGFHHEQHSRASRPPHSAHVTRLYLVIGLFLGPTACQMDRSGVSASLRSASPYSASSACDSVNRIDVDASVISSSGHWSRTTSCLPPETFH